MKDLFLAFLLVFCGLAGLALIHKKEDSEVKLPSEMTRKGQPIIIKAINGEEHEKDDEIKVLDGNDIHISKDSANIAFH